VICYAHLDTNTEIKMNNFSVKYTIKWKKSIIFYINSKNRRMLIVISGAVSVRCFITMAPASVHI